ncbi:MAG: hypothetical protein Q8R51_10005, partial [Azonexus sp.]|nr:hypothetical protein [Azonexus sp.]
SRQADLLQIVDPTRAALSPVELAGRLVDADLLAIGQHFPPFTHLAGGSLKRGQTPFHTIEILWKHAKYHWRTFTS